MTNRSDMALAEFLDRCCARYAKEPAYRVKLRLELDKKHDARTRRTAA